MQVFTHTTAPHKGALRHPIPRLPQATNNTPAAQATKKSSALLSTRAWTRSISKAGLADMGITPDDYDLIVAQIRSDAAANGGTARTKRVIAALRATDHAFSDEAIRIIAGSVGVDLEVGQEKGQGGGARPGAGRPPGSKDRRPRASPRKVERSGRSDRGKRRVDVTPLQAFMAYESTRTEGGPGSLRAAAAKLGVSHATVSDLLVEYRASKPAPDEESNNQND